MASWFLGTPCTASRYSPAMSMRLSDGGIASMLNRDPLSSISNRILPSGPRIQPVCFQTSVRSTPSSSIFCAIFIFSRLAVFARRPANIPKLPLGAPPKRPPAPVIKASSSIFLGSEGSFWALSIVSIAPLTAPEARLYGALRTCSIVGADAASIAGLTSCLYACSNHVGKRLSHKERTNGVCL